MRDFLRMGPETATRAALAPPPSDHVCALALAAGVSERMAVPAGAGFVNISATGDVFVTFGDAAVVAAVPGDVADGTASALNPGARQIPEGVTHIAIVSEDDGRATLEFWG